MIAEDDAAGKKVVARRSRAAGALGMLLCVCSTRLPTRELGQRKPQPHINLLSSAATGNLINPCKLKALQARWQGRSALSQFPFAHTPASHQKLNKQPIALCP